MKFLLTCEHGGNEIPQQYREIFKSSSKLLNSHRGFDPGALDLFLQLKKAANFSHYSTVSRLLVELNRSPRHPQLFSEITRRLPSAKKEEILSSFYFPYRNLIEAKIEEWIQEGEEVIHLSIHTFTPVLNGITRNADIGFLYDPSRAAEKVMVQNWKQQLHAINPDLKIRFNYPYLGTADGFTTWLRKKFPLNYAGVEVEVNQNFAAHNTMEKRLKEDLLKMLLQVNDKLKKA